MTSRQGASARSARSAGAARNSARGMVRNPAGWILALASRPATAASRNRRSSPISPPPPRRGRTEIGGNEPAPAYPLENRITVGGIIDPVLVPCLQHRPQPCRGDGQE